MSALLFVIAAIAVPDRPIEKPPPETLVGKTVYSRVSPLYLDPSPEPNEQIMKNGPALNMLSFKIYAERPNHVQIKTREGQLGWVRKADIVLPDEAVAFFTKQIETNPKDSNAYNRRAAAWRARGELDAAIQDATEAIRINANYVLYNNRALIWHAKKDYAKALADYEVALNQNPQYFLAFANRATVWQSKKEYDKAIADATQSIQFAPQMPGAYRQRGIAHHAKKDYDKAIADFNKALEIDAKSAQYRAERAASWSAKKEYGHARADFEEALKLEPSNVTSVAAAAMWFASCPDDKYRDGKRAMELAKKAQKLERNNSQAIQALAAAHAELGQFEDAVRWQEHAMGDLQLKEDADAQTRLDLYREKKAYRRD